MIFNTKTEFLTGLRIALEQNNISDTRDILTDFRQHFEDGEAAGESEADVCRKLGDVDDIVKQYISDLSEKNAGAEENANAFDGNTYEQPQQNYQQTYQQPAVPPVQPQPSQSGSGVNAGKLVGVLILDMLVYSWAIPALLGLICGLIGIAVAFSVSGIVLMFVGLISVGINLGGVIVTGFAPLTVAALGLMLGGLGGMLVIASIGSVKGFINVCIAIINQHGRACTGRNVLDKIGKKKEAVL